MKKTILFAFLTILIASSLSGQEFISTEKQWNVRVNGWASSYSTEIYIIDGDSVVDDLNYQKILVSYDSLASWDYQGLIREDSGVVYYLPPDRDEGVLYNFNLEVGDTARIINIFCTDVPIHIADIDTVEYFGKSRKRWTLGKDGYIRARWIEGIGCLNGPLHTKFEYCMACPYWELLCYHNNDTLQYQMPGETECYQTTVGITDLNREYAFTLSPNPVRKGNSIHLESQAVPVNISIFNAAGLLVKNLNPMDDTKIEIETNSFKPGLYFISVTSKEDKKLTKKFLVQ
ncbi:MAG: T9SS type A sorting domain-containing protein [Bacteroidales bacterium]|nr:T9SS type A sorting domain-containing protein [Bacteroidales bacterium]MCF8334252.1 T9SS type A sorting domain-containing protein [Bacteroidales bacterium]